jgi:hypothetical protein
MLDLGVAGQKRAPWIADDEQTLLFELDFDSIYISRRSGDVFGPAIILVGQASDPFVVGGVNGRLYFVEDGLIMMVVLQDWDPFGGSTWIELSGLGVQRPAVSADELTLYFGSDDDILQARRASVSEEFQLTDLTIPLSAGANLPSWTSPDECRLYFDVGNGLYVLERSPP